MLFSGIIFIILLLLGSVHRHSADRPTVCGAFHLLHSIYVQIHRERGQVSLSLQTEQKIDICFCTRHDETIAVVASMRLPLSQFCIAASTSFQPSVICFVREHETQLMTGCKGKMKHFPGLYFRPLLMSIHHHTLARFISAFAAIL